MTTLSDIPSSLGAAAADHADNAPNVEHTRAARTRDARARASVTQGGVLRHLRQDLRSAWVWRETPPSLSDVVAGRRATGDVPGQHKHMRSGWVVWNVVVAVPATAACYVIAWVLQHPARTGLAAVIAAPLIVMWIK